MSNSGSGIPKNGLLHGCFDEGCSYHPGCEESMNEIKSLGGVAGIYAAVSSAPGRKLQGVVLNLGRYVSINRARHAVQVEGCDGRIIAHIPLSRDQIAELGV